MMHTNFQPSEADRRFYEESLRDFLPEKIFDIHSHLVPPGTIQSPSLERKQRLWPLNLPCVQTIDEYFGAYEKLFPGKFVQSLVFGLPIEESDINRQNRMILFHSREHRHVHPLFVARPTDDPELFEKAIAEGFRGFKPYPDLASIAEPGEERITDFLTPAMCRVADAHRALVILHISKSRRFADPDNIRDLQELSQTYPKMKLVIAHLGRSFNPVYLERGLDMLDGQCRWWYDFSAVTNPEVFRVALERIPRDRLCFGSDLPLMLARGYYDFPSPDSYEVHINGYNMEDPNHPPLVYQILSGFKQAAEDLNLSRQEIKSIFHDNAMNLLNLD